jgi:hypothetical protein
MAAPGNWYLFDTMDIVKRSGQVVHASTSLMPGPVWQGFCSEQMDVAGVLKPVSESTQPVSWGVVEGTSIGYIYV